MKKMKMSSSEHKNICPECGDEMTVVVGDRADSSYGEYLECPGCGYDNNSGEENN